MSLEAWTLLVGIFTAVFAVGVATAALLRAYIPPQTRAVQELRSSVEDLADDNDRIHGRLNERAARANLEKARGTRAEKQSLLEEAAEIVKGAKTPAPAQLDVEAQRTALRNKFLNS